MRAVTHVLAKMQWVCVRRNKKASALALAFSLGMLLSSVLEVAWPLAAAEPGPDPFMERVAWVGAAVLLFCAFLLIKCIYERLWSGVAAAATTIMTLRMFDPSLAGHLVGGLKVVVLSMWLAATIISLTFVRSAFRGRSSNSTLRTNTEHDAEGNGGPRCPACGSPLPRRAIRLASPFQCSSCSAQLRVPCSYLWRIGAIGLALALAIAYLLGPTGRLFALVLAIAWLPATLLVLAASKLYPPPRPRLLESQPKGSG